MTKDTTILALHVDDQTLTWVAARSNSASLSVLASDRVDLEPGWVQLGRVQEPVRLSRLIRKSLAAHRIRVPQAIFTLTCGATRLRPAVYYVKSPVQLDAQIRDDYERYVPVGRKDTLMEHCISEERRSIDGGYSVLHAMIGRPTSDACLNLARTSNFDPVVLEPAILQILRLLSRGPRVTSTSTRLILVMDSVSANLCAMQGSDPLVVQNLPMGYATILADPSAAATLASHMRSAWEYIRSLDPRSPVVMVMSNSPRQELRQVVRLLQPQLPGIAMRAWGTSRLLQQFGAHSEDRRDLPLIPLASLLGTVTPRLPLGPINLISSQSLMEERTRRQMSSTARVIVALVLVAISVLIPLKGKVRRVTADCASLEEQIAQTEPLFLQITSLQEDLKKIRLKIATYERGFRQLPDTPWHVVLKDIGAARPADVRLVGIDTEDSGRFRLLGQARTEALVHEFVKRLTQVSTVRSAVLEEVDHGLSQEGIVDYRITGLAQAGLREEP